MRSRGVRETGPPAWPCSKSPNQRSRVKSALSMALGCIASGMLAGRWAHASAMMEGFSDYILITIDMQAPAKPQIVGRYCPPGMNLAAGETANWPLERGRYGLHHAVVADDIAYCAWRDGCLVTVDVADKSNPKQIVHRNRSLPFGGGTHNCLPLPDRDLTPDQFFSVTVPENFRSFDFRPRRLHDS